MRVSVIIPIWVINDELLQLSINTLNSFGMSLLPGGDELELIVLDNGSTWNTDLIKDNVDIYIRNKVNQGFPKAVNQAIKLATGDLICVANNDIKVSDNWWIVAKEAFEKVKEIGTLHFRMLGYDEPNIPADQVYPDGKERWCHGSFYVIRKSLYEEFGGYDEAFGIGGYDDYDFWKRLRGKGYKQAYTNGAFFQHKDSSSQLLRDPNERSESDRKNREYYKEKWGEYPDIEFANQFPEQMKLSWRPYP